MEGQELLFFNPLLVGRRRGAVSQHSPEMTQTGGTRLSRFLGHHQPRLGSPGCCPRVAALMSATAILSHTQLLGPAFGLYLLGGCGFKAQNLCSGDALVQGQGAHCHSPHTAAWRKVWGNVGSGECMEAIPFF